MTDKKIQGRFGILVLIVFAVALSRLVPYFLNIEETFNFTPLAAIALFGGAYFMNKSNAIFYPLIALWVSNLIIDNVFLSQYYEGFALFANWEVYVAILAIVGLAMVVLRKVSLPRVVGASIMASVLFFAITNLAVWVTSGLYDFTFNGLVECFTLAIPFFRNTIASDLIFSLLLFGVYEWAAMRYSILKAKTA